MDQFFRNIAKGALLAVLVTVCVECILRMPWVGEWRGNKPGLEETPQLTSARQHNQAADQQVEAAAVAFSANQKSLQAAATFNRIDDELYQLCEIIADTPIRNEIGLIIGSVSAGTVVRYYPRIDPMKFTGDLKTYARIALSPFETDDLCWVPVELVGCKSVVQKAPEWLPMASTDPTVAYQWYVELAPGQTSPPLPVSVDQEFDYEFFTTGSGTQVFRHFNNGPWELFVGGQPKPQPRLRQSFLVQVRLHPAADHKERIRFVLKNPQGDKS